VHPKKESLLIVVTEDTIVKDVKEVQPENARSLKKPSPMALRDDGELKVTEAKLLHPLNACPPIAVTLDGILIDDNELQPKNKLDPTVVVEFGRVTE
jgi:hypothetical protein